MGYNLIITKSRWSCMIYAFKHLHWHDWDFKHTSTYIQLQSDLMLTNHRLHHLLSSYGNQEDYHSRKGQMFLDDPYKSPHPRNLVRWHHGQILISMILHDSYKSLVYLIFFKNLLCSTSGANSAGECDGWPWTSWKSSPMIIAESRETGLLLSRSIAKPSTKRGRKSNCLGFLLPLYQLSVLVKNLWSKGSRS